MRKFLLTLVMLTALCGISSADMVYMTSTGNLGTIKINSSSDIEAPGIQYTGALSSPFLTSYWNGSSTSLAIISRNATSSGDRAYVFNPNNLTNYSYSADIEGVYGTDGAGYAESGYSIFLMAGSRIYEVETGNFEVKNSFDCTRVISADGYDTEIDSISVGAQTIHVIASAGGKQRYIRFDGQLKEGVNYFISSDVSEGASVVLSTSNSIPVIGHSTGIDAMDNSRKFYRLISSDYPVKAMCPDNSNGFFYATQYQDGGSYVNTIMHSAQGTQFTPITATSASSNIKLLRDNKNPETFAVMTDESVIICTYKDWKTSTREYPASALGGTLSGIASATVSGYDGNSSSSGCNVAGMGLVALGIMLLTRRVKRAER